LTLDSLAKLHARGVAQRLGVKSGLIYLPGLPQVNFEDSDQPAYFRQRRYFFYLSGLDLPNVRISPTAPHFPRLHLITVLTVLICCS
jgi:hypothetical protein